MTRASKNQAATPFRYDETLFRFAPISTTHLKSEINALTCFSQSIAFSFDFVVETFGFAPATSNGAGKSENVTYFGILQCPRFPQRKEMWASLLGLLAFKESDRVSITHFFEVDILVKSSIDGSAMFDSIDRIRPTKYQLADTGNFSKISPARPAASKADILNSIFVGTSALLYSDYMLSSLSWSGRTSKLSSKRVKKSMV